jgi:N-acetylmuramoyl-L-alanine amidase
LKKNISFFYFLVAFYSINLVQGIHSENILSIEKKNYFKASNLIESLKIKISEKDNLTDIIELVGTNQKRINFLVNTNFMSYNGKVYFLEDKIRYKKNELFLPRGTLKSILNYLVDENFSITNLSEEIYYKIYSRETLVQEEISLQSIIIDPGHGGREYGATSIHSDHEKIYNLEISILLEKYLKKKFPHLNVYMVRENDKIYSLDERSNMANTKLNISKNTIFLSIHCNSIKGEDRSPKGFEVYYLDQKKSIYEDREKLTIQKSIINSDRSPDIQKIYSDMYVSMVQRRSILLAQSIEKNLKNLLGKRMRSRGVKRESFHVLRKNLMPAVLIEIGFLTNEDDFKIIANADMQNLIVKGIYEGIKLYAERKDH